MRPSGISDAAWAAEWPSVQATFGPTWGDYVTQLDRAAQVEPTPSPGPVLNVQDLFNSALVLGGAWLASVPDTSTEGAVGPAGGHLDLVGSPNATQSAAASFSRFSQSGVVQMSLACADMLHGNPIIIAA